MSIQDEVTVAPTLTEKQIKHMVDRFLGWHLPMNFNPDAGIRYERLSYQRTPETMPSGTNLLDASQADAMIRYLVSEMPKDEETLSLMTPSPKYPPALIEKVTVAVKDGHPKCREVPGAKSCVVGYAECACTRIAIAALDASGIGEMREALEALMGCHDAYCRSFGPGMDHDAQCMAQARAALKVAP